MKKEEVKTDGPFEDVFDALFDDPVEVENLKMRSDLMIKISETVKRNGWTQAEAAKVMDVKQPEISYIVHGKLHKFTIDKLVKMLARSGEHVRLVTGAKGAAETSFKRSRRTRVRRAMSSLLPRQSRSRSKIAAKKARPA